VIAVGGGIVGDVAGFAAATYLRGVPVIQVPTTLLAQVDASVGGKTGVNLPLSGGGLGKNLVGSFWQPRAVIADPCVLTTMDAREYRCGLAECIKHGVIGDRSLLAWLQEHREAILGVDPTTVAALVDRAISVKIALVQADEREGGIRAHLNLGHTFGHAIEAHPGLDYRHGEAVAVGLIAASTLGMEVGSGDRQLHDQLINLLVGFGLPVTLPAEASIEQLTSFMTLDKKRTSGSDRLIVPSETGVEILTDPPPEAILASWNAVGA
jgi:3-dehydroquinate synthase